MSAKKRANRRRGRSILVWAGLGFALLQAVPAFLLPRTTEAPFNDLGVWGVPPVEASIVQWQTRRLLHGDSAPDVVFFGDSSCLMGVRPSLVQEITGLPSSNFGMLGWLGTEGHAEILRLYLQKHPPPRLAVYYICAYPLTATSKDIEGAGYLRAFLDWTSAGQRQGPLFWLADQRVRRYVQTAMQRLLAQPDQQQAHLSAPRGVYPSDRDTARLLTENQGFIPERCPPAVQGAGQTYTPKFCPDCAAGLERMFDLADRHRVRLAVVMNPLPEAYRSAGTDEAMRQLQRTLHSLASAHRYVEIKRPLQRYYPNECFGTVNHLLAPGVDRNSRELGHWIVEALRLDGKPVLQARSE